MADPKPSGGRRNALLELVMKSQASSSGSGDATTPSTSPEFHSLSPSPTGLPPSAPRGRAGLLQKVQQLEQLKISQQRETLQSPPIPTVPRPISAGRASLLSLAQRLSNPGSSRSMSPATPEPLARPTSSGDASGVLGPLSALAVDDKSPTLDSAPISRQGQSGKTVNIAANFINLKIQPNRGIFCYEVKFTPAIDALYLRRNLLSQHSEALGTTRTFDGTTLCLPIKLRDERTMFDSLHPSDGTNVRLEIIYKKKQKMSESVLFFNVLLRRIMRALDLVCIGRDNFNPRCAHRVPQHRLELWPGYVTAIDEYEGGLKLNINASHRAIRTDTVRDLISDIFKKCPANARESVMAETIGITVLTRYNNRTYRIDDVDWAKSPKFLFTKKNDEQISIYDYYRTHWNIEIKDRDQPLLLNRSKKKTSSGETVEQVVFLVPELCYLAGLTDALRSDHKVMRDLASVTQLTPEPRRNVILKFLKEVQSNEVAKELLNGWGLELADDIVKFGGRRLDPEQIIFGNGKTFTSPKADWGGAVVSSAMLRTPHMTKWCIVSTEKDARICNEFVSMLKRVSERMSMNVGDPIFIRLKNDRTENYLSEIRRVITPELQMVVTICPTNRTDRYAAIKKLCCVEKPIRSQVINTRTISQSNKLQSITEKIALQMNCKLGGALWALKIPFDNCMICGVDVYHPPKGDKSKPSVAAFVASLDKPLTSWYSRICPQRSNQELVDVLKICMVAAIEAYAKRNGTLPERIILYRDGLGDGQLATVAGYEVKQLQAAFSSIEDNYKPKFTVIIVQKRVNCRILLELNGKLQNPDAGTIVDSVITRRNWYDFYLVSVTSRQGTVSPTHYVVVHDEAEMKTDHLQRLSYKLCHLYYNWPGTVKVPAPCQYAHKLAYLVGESVGQEPSKSLAESLYYL